MRKGGVLPHGLVGLVATQFAFLIDGQTPIPKSRKLIADRPSQTKLVRFL